MGGELAVLAVAERELESRRFDVALAAAGAALTGATRPVDDGGAP
ncbi:MAG TPA: hypothetical protein PLF81_25810 [Candidatus Anammoximicrobium sp.]|nr:hypothetical protein [Candidatus Anammoximicrobium sp.]